ncbi:MAG: hypothetical protein ACKVK8_03415 [Rhodospirillales bacterium]
MHFGYKRIANGHVVELQARAPIIVSFPKAMGLVAKVEWLWHRPILANRPHRWVNVLASLWIVV